MRASDTAMVAGDDLSAIRLATYRYSIYNVVDEEVLTRSIPPWTEYDGSGFYVSVGRCILSLSHLAVVTRQNESLLFTVEIDGNVVDAESSSQCQYNLFRLVICYHEESGDVTGRGISQVFGEIPTGFDRPFSWIHHRRRKRSTLV